MQTDLNLHMIKAGEKKSVHNLTFRIGKKLSEELRELTILYYSL